MIIMKRNQEHIKFSILFLLTVFVSNPVKSQDPRLVYIEDYLTMDSAYFEISYEVKIKPDASKDSSYYEDLQILQIGKSISKTFSYRSYQTDSAATKWLKQGRDTYPLKPYGAITHEIYKKFQTHKIDFFDVIYDEVFLYEEEIPKMNWQIHNEKKRILDYDCQRATTTFRGREWETWFAIEIPISDGPYKFTGLPGLILEIHDTQNHYHYECVGVKPLNSAKPITRRNWTLITTITRQKYSSLYKQYCDNPLWLEHKQGITVSLKGVDGKEISTQNFRLPYNPVELE
jgi:GLPGLI family protein